MKELIKEALENAPEIKTIQYEIEAERWKIKPSKALPDPMIELSFQFMGINPPGDDSALILEFNQELPFPGKLESFKELAIAELEIKNAELLKAKSLVVQEVKRLFASIYALDAEKENLFSAAGVIDLLVESISTGQTYGQVDQEALLKTRIERAMIEENLINLEKEREDLLSGLNYLLDKPPLTPFHRIKEIPSVVEKFPENLEELVIKNSPEILLSQAMIQKMEWEVKIAQWETRPNFLAGIGGGVNKMDEPIVMMKFGVSLPIWRKGKQNLLVRAKVSELEAVKAGLYAVQSQTLREIKILTNQFEREKNLIKLYEELIIPQSYLAFESARSAYLSGQGDFSTIIEDFTLWLQAKSELYKIYAEHFITYAKVKRHISPLEE